MPSISRRSLIGSAAAAGLISGKVMAANKPVASVPMLAPTPPMGWNSWNSFATTITEPQVLETAQIMVDKLRPFGYDILTIDIQWYEPNATGYDYRDGAELSMDGYGRLLPAPNRFPSSANGAGFKPIGDELHDSFLRFGIHLMRGIPRLAVERNLPIFGTSYHARDIADTNSICTWNKDMYGVDMRKPGAQAYYNSVFKLLAEWGVDFVKMDDMSRPYGDHHLEIEAAHKAIEASGRPMILSLSPGETDIKWAAHVQQYAQMWRISDDFWDDWQLLKDQFKRLKDWTPWRGPGSWPDADMLPLGLLALGKRKTRFTPAEQTTLMTLWAIARSPLIMGGDLRALDEPTLALLTNEEVLKVNQHSLRNRARYMKNEGDAYHYWTAEPEDGKGIYIALFNLADQERFRYINLAELGMRGGYDVRDLWAKTSLGEVKDRFGIVLPPHGAGLFFLK